MVDQPLTPASEFAVVPGLAGEVPQLIRIVEEIEQLLLAVTSVEDVFPAPIRQSVPVIFGTVATVVLEIDVLPPFSPVVPQEIEETPPVDWPSALRSGSLEERGEDVAELDRLLQDRASLCAHESRGPAHQHRNTRGRLVGVRFAPEIVIARHVAMIGGE